LGLFLSLFDVERSKFDVLPLKMTARPIHRWKSFWLGVLVLSFLGWAWVRSMHRIDEISYKVPTSSRSWGACTGFGAVLMGCSDDPFAPDGLRFSSSRANPDWGTTWFPDAILLEGGADESWQNFSIAHWFLILLFLVSWTGFLLRRVRRMRRGGEMPPHVEK
jgi:hypothetical protein